MNCTLCNTILEQRADESYFICGGCGAYVKEKALYFDQNKEKAHYEQHNNDVDDIGYQRFTSPLTNKIMELCNASMVGLDYGCGKGPVITKQLVEQGYMVHLYDPYFYPDTSYLSVEYDYIFSCEVFEHFYNPFEELTKLVGLLKSGGYLLIKTHLYVHQQPFKSWYYRKDLTHVFIYTPHTFEYIAQHFNLTIVELSERMIVLYKNE